MIYFRVFFLSLKVFISDFVFRKRNNILKHIRAVWDNQDTGTVRPNEELTAIYFRYYADDSDTFINDRVWYDLNMESLFEKIDRCVSSVGRQVLFGMMRTYRSSESFLHESHKQYHRYIRNKEFREEIQYALFDLRDKKHCYVPDLMFNVENAYNKGKYYIYSSALLLAVCIGLIPWISVMTLPALFLAIHNLILVYLFKQKAGIYFPAARSLGILMRTASSLTRITCNEKNEVLTELKGLQSEIDKINSRLSWFLVDSSELPSFVAVFVDFINLFFLYDIISYCRAVDIAKKRRDVIIRTFELVGKLDAEISFASFLNSIQYYTMPEFVDGINIDLTEPYHPLLTEPVSNSFTVNGHSVMFTGSNMSGKTTFIRTIALNTVTAWTLGVCFAEEAKISRLYVKSLIRREDDILSGKSYYFQEVEDLLALIDKSNTPGKYLFIIDEIFRGTNTVERIASSAAVLEYMCRNNIVLVTTHDLELQEILNEKYKMYHFSEQVEGERYYFDYKLNEGPCYSRNAIRLLELKGYPEPITNRAHSLTRTNNPE